MEDREKNSADNAQNEELDKIRMESRAKSEFISRMSHDIRTPMNNIMGLTSIAIANIEDTQRVQDCLNKIAMSGNHMLNLINDVLDISRIENGVFTICEDEINLKNLIYNVIEMIHTPSSRKHQELSADITGIMHENVIGDELHIKEVLMNVLGNAVKYTDENGKIQLTVLEKERKDENIACYEFVVQDSGIGMEESFIQHIFEPFAREERMGWQISGTGLGMTIARKLAVMMNGDIRVKSRKGKGSEFTVTLCLKLREDGRDVHKHPETLSEKDELQEDTWKSRDFSNKRILLVEDNPLNCEIESEIIGTTGAIVEIAENGRLAVEKVKNSPEEYYDLIFMDIRMPEMDGYQATKLIRKMERGDCQKIPVIAMTANAFADDTIRAREAGMNGHISKPVDMNRLFQIMENLML